MAEVGTVMEMILREFKTTDAERLRSGDYNELTKVWWNRGVLLKCSAVDIEGTDETCHAEAVFILNGFRTDALMITPCLRGLMQEVSTGRISSKHDEMVKCCFDHYQKWLTDIGTACEQFAPELWEFYNLKFN